MKKSAACRQLQFPWLIDPPYNQVSGKITRDTKLVAISLVGRRLAFVTLVCSALVPEDMQKGDVAAILGCPFPVIIWPVETEYKFIKEYFVHGLFMGLWMGSGESIRKVEVVLC
jgi:hypothetical protein